LESLAFLSSNGYEVIEISNVSTQVVAGTIYNFDLTFRNELSDHTRVFRVKAIIVPWEGVAEVLEANELPPPTMKPKYGGAAPYTFNKENAMDKLILEAVENKSKNLLGKEKMSTHKFKEVRNATNQLVAGNIYKFDIVFANDEGNDEVIFEAVVYVVPWENKLEIQSLTVKDY